MPATTIPGAIRWDAWYGTGSGSEAFVNPGVCQSLGPSQYQSRAPWFGTPLSTLRMSINGNTQATMDAEIAYAKGAGLKYWAYCWYGQQSPASPMQNAWSLHQSSTTKNDMNWCLLFQFSRLSPSIMTANQATYVSYFQQANYQTVLSGRPLVYLFMDVPTSLATNWSNSLTNVQTAFNALRTAATTAGLPTPYIVIMYGTASQAATYMTGISADAISNYTAGSSGAYGGQTYPAFDTLVQAFWASCATSSPTGVVPICQTGYDTRPRKELAFLAGTKPHFGNNVYVAAPTAVQLTAHLQAAVTYVGANPTICPSKAVIIYSWNECDEGGSALIPSYSAGGPVTTLLNAAGAVTW